MVAEYREFLQEQGKYTWSFPPKLLWNINSTEYWTAVVLIFKLRQKANIVATQWALHFSPKAERLVYLDKFLSV